MARTITLSDDFDSSAQDNVQEVRVKVTRDGVTTTWTADLGDASFDTLVTKPLGKLRKVGSEVGTGQDSPEALQDKAIRQWGKDHNYDVKDRGRIAATIRSAYFEANPNEEDLANA